MTRKQLKELISKSYTRARLDPEKVDAIANALSRQDLKDYIKAIKLQEKKKNVLVALPYLPSDEEKKKIQDMYPGKSVVYDIDPSLMIGLRINDNDTVIDYSVKSTLEHLLEHIEQTYD